MPDALKSAAKVAMAATSLALAYWAGAANAEAVAKLDQAHDLLTKGRAVLGTIDSRPSYGAVEAAKAKIDGALNDIANARKQNGG